jgi:hypothetical protein
LISSLVDAEFTLSAFFLFYPARKSFRDIVKFHPKTMRDIYTAYIAEPGGWEGLIQAVVC